jgi:hypothetical protein
MVWYGMGMNRVVVEVYSSFFGSCQSIGPTINGIMLSYPDPESKIKWLVVIISHQLHCNQTHQHPLTIDVL